LLNNGIISGISPTPESDSSPRNQGFNKEIGDLSCLFILVISNADFFVGEEPFCLLLAVLIDTDLLHALYR
jgi:hypothetical protein